MIAFLLIFVALCSFGCGSTNSLKSASYSDNKTFKARQYSKNEPIRPFGNLKDSRDDETKTIEYYENYTSEGYASLKENEEYLMWLASQRRKRLASGKLNGFKQESMPSLNEYYIKKTRNNAGKNFMTSEIRYLDIDKQIYQTKKKKEQDKTINTIDKINDYRILNNIADDNDDIKVKSNEYHTPF